ncbi:hypothetical protein BSK65_04925 [Paenibacillus odorifer]|uniref:Uncharacterized protein n=1 Tax=Paenibacillus odorifer TaxID=189426 RepID=A0A1R0ZM31_9BACL|nr:hypothetical protein [Paenibacillus odorifer]OME73146.1 hypothetical protein BSK65_04925 [Paenibacillus odorifer]
MSDWYLGIKSKEKETSGGRQGVIKNSQLSPEEKAGLDLKYRRPTGKAVERPFVIKGSVE